MAGRTRVDRKFAPAARAAAHEIALAPPPGRRSAQRSNHGAAPGGIFRKSRPRSWISRTGGRCCRRAHSGPRDRADATSIQSVCGLWMDGETAVRSTRLATPRATRRRTARYRGAGARDLPRCAATAGAIAARYGDAAKTSAEELTKTGRKSAPRRWPPGCSTGRPLRLRGRRRRIRRPARQAGPLSGWIRPPAVKIVRRGVGRHDRLLDPGEDADRQAGRLLVAGRDVEQPGLRRDPAGPDLGPQEVEHLVAARVDDEPDVRVALPVAGLGRLEAVAKDGRGGLGSLAAVGLDRPDRDEHDHQEPADQGAAMDAPITRAPYHGRRSTGDDRDQSAPGDRDAGPRPASSRRPSGSRSGATGRNERSIRDRAAPTSAPTADAERRRRVIRRPPRAVGTSPSAASPEPSRRCRTGPEMPGSASRRPGRSRRVRRGGSRPTAAAPEQWPDRSPVAAADPAASTRT